MSVNYPCPPWKGFILEILRRAARSYRQTASGRRWRFLRTTPSRWESRRRSGRRRRRRSGTASASGGQCVWMRLDAHHGNSTHALTVSAETDGQSDNPARSSFKNLQSRWCADFSGCLTSHYFDYSYCYYSWFCLSGKLKRSQITT